MGMMGGIEDGMAANRCDRGFCADRGIVSDRKAGSEGCPEGIRQRDASGLNDR